MNRYNFAAAAPEEEVVFGARRPEHPRTPPGSSVQDWIDYMQEQGIERVCCLLTEDHLEEYEGLLGQYRQAFGAGTVRHAPIPDFEVVDRQTLTQEILPFLDEADARAEPVVVHCSAGSGRTGHVLALWLTCARGFALPDAIEIVRETGRRPLEAADTEQLSRLVQSTG